MRAPLNTLTTVLKLFTDAVFTNVMDNFRSFGFATPDGVCNSYASRGGCDVVPTVDSTCLGPVSVCKKYLLLMRFSFAHPNCQTFGKTACTQHGLPTPCGLRDYSINFRVSTNIVLSVQLVCSEFSIEDTFVSDSFTAEFLGPRTKSATHCPSGRLIPSNIY